MLFFRISMKVKTKYFILAFLVLPVVHLKSQEKWDLKKCINYAMENNLEHHIFQLDEEATGVNFLQSKMNMLPGISAETRYGISYGRSTDPNTNDIINTEHFSNSYGLSANVCLFQGFEQINTISYYNYRKKAGYWNTLKSKDDLAFSVLMAYYDIIYYRGLVRITREQLDLSAYNLKKVETEVSIGTKSNADLTEIQANYEYEKLNYVQAKNNLAEAEIILAKTLNLPVDKEIAIIYDSNQIFLEPEISDVNDSVIYRFLEVAPVLQSSEAMLYAAKKNIAMQRGSYYPNMYFVASMGTGYYETDTDASGNITSFNTQLNNNLNQYIGIRLSIPIFQRYNNISNVKQAKIDYEKAVSDYQDQKLELYYQVSNDIRKREALKVEYFQLEKQVEANELAYKAASRKYEEGLFGIIEMLTVKSRLASSKSQLLQTRLQWEIQYKLMEFYKGVRFWEL